MFTFTMCHVHLSHVTCNMSHVTCDLSPVTLNLQKNMTQWLSQFVKGLLSTGPTLSIFSVTKKISQIDRLCYFENDASRWCIKQDSQISKYNKTKNINVVQCALNIIFKFIYFLLRKMIQIVNPASLKKTISDYVQ